MSEALVNFPPMTAFDIEATLQRLLGRKDLLCRVMQAFAQSSAESERLLRHHFAQQDFQSAQALAHQIKGSAANMGAMQLSAVAAEIEQQLKQGLRTTPEILLSQFGEALQAVLTDIARLDALPSATSTQSWQKLDRAAVERSVQIIEHCLRTDLGKVQQEMQTLSRLVAGSELQVTMNALNRAFDQFQMTEVASLLQAFMAASSHEHQE